MSKKIKSTTLYKLDNSGPASESTEDQGGVKYSYTEFNQNGQITTEIKYNINGDAEEKYIYKFDGDGKLIEEISYLTDDEVAEHKTYEYNETGKILHAFKHYADGSKDITEYSYNAAGMVTEKITKDEDGEIEERELLVYKDGNLETRELFESGKQTLKETFRFDEKGNLIENTSDSVDEGKTRFVHNYNEDGILEKTLNYNDKNELVGKTVYELNDAGKIVQLNEENPFEKSETKLVYDEHGNAVEQIETNALGEVNNHIIRAYNEYNDVVESKVNVNFHGARIDQDYILKYEYVYYD